MVKQCRTKLKALLTVVGACFEPLVELVCMTHSDFIAIFSLYNIAISALGLWSNQNDLQHFLSLIFKIKFNEYLNIVSPFRFEITVLNVFII